MCKVNFGVYLIFGILAAYTVDSRPSIPTTIPTTKTSSTQQPYNSKFDNVDLDQILSQDRLLNNYIKCLENSGPCTPDANMLKDILPDAMMTDCAKCTKKQKCGADKVIRHLIDKRPEDWLHLEKIYDSQGSYRIKYEKFKNTNNRMK